MEQTDKIDLSHIRKAQRVFEDYRRVLTTDKEKTATVQAFEFCYELAWKLMKRILEARGFEVGAPKDIFRKAALDHLIDDPELWFDFQKKRNLTSHSYNIEYLNEIVAIFDTFSRELRAFLQKAEELQ